MTLSLKPSGTILLLIYLFLFLFLKQFLYSAQTTKHVCSLEGQEYGLCLIALCELLHHLDILLCEQVVGRIGALAYCLRDFLNGDGFSLSLTDAGLCFTLCTQDFLLLGSLSTVDCGCLLTL